MKKRFHSVNLLQDDRGAALVEIAIAIPVVLLFFLGMLQYLQVFRASQLGNYAAWCAARVYAVRASVDGREIALDKGTDAAALALAPTARLVPKEIFGFGGPLNVGSRVGSSSSLSGLQLGGRLADLGEGYVIARYVRLNPALGGGSVRINTSGDPRQVNVEINYPQPIFIPGLAELWRFVGERKSIQSDLSGLSDGLTGIPGIERGGSNPFGGLLPGLPSFSDLVPLLPYVNVRSKCSIGYEPWGRRNNRLYGKYQPRMPRTVTE